MNEQERAAQDAAMRELGDAIPTLVWTRGRDGGLAFVNRAFREFVGESDVVGIGDAVLDFVHPNDRDATIAAWRAALTTGQVREFTFRLQRTDGAYRWHRATMTPVHDESGAVDHWVGTAVDIDDITRSQQQYEATAHRLIETLNNMSDGFFTLDPEWRFTYLNDAAEQLLTVEAAELIGEDIGALAPAITPTMRAQLEQTMRDRDPAAFEEYVEPLHRWLGVNAYATNDGIAVYFRDITDRHLADEHIRHQARLIDEAVDAILVRDLDDRVVSWNRGAERVYGWSEEEAIGQSVSALIYPDEQHEEYRDGTTQVLLDGEWRHRVPQRRRDGSALMVEVNWTLLKDDSGMPNAILAINHDVTTQVALEEQLHQAQRLDGLGQLTGGVAHDFNNLLTVIIGATESLADLLPDNSPLYIYADMARRAADRGAILTRRLLSFARRQPLEPMLHDLNAIVTGIEPLLRASVGESINIEVMPADDLWPVMVDLSQIETSLVNLVVNARDALPTGGKITIETENVRLDETYAAEHSEVQAGQYALLAVSDTGHGMPPEVVQQVFEPFFTTKARGAGTGLGLSMVYGFLKQSGGHISIYSEMGSGTTVRLYFPRASVGAGVVTEVPSPVVEHLGGNEHVLVVEDDDLVRAHVTDQLLSLGYRVSAVSSGSEALEQLRSRSPFDLLFTDVVMPGMSGPDLMQASRLLRPDLPVLFTSGYAENAIVHHGHIEAGIDLLTKPYTRAQMARKVRQILDEGSPL